MSDKEDSRINGDPAYTKRYTNYNTSTETSTAIKYTSRPTNTSVLYCIKYEPTYFMKNTYNADNVYSTDEMIIGKWIDGKPLHRKVIETTTPSSTSATGIAKLDNMRIIKIDGHIQISATVRMAVNSYNTSSDYNVIWYSEASIAMQTTHLSCPVMLIIEYTKTTD